MNKVELSENIRKWSEELGFVAFGAVPYRLMDKEIERFEDYLSLGYNAGMKYLEQNRDIRRDASLLLPGLKSVLCFLAPYRHGLSGVEGNPAVSSYALGVDYHPLIKGKLREILSKIRQISPEANGRVFTDSAPVLEREWAASAGLGFIGRNNFLISREYGLHTLIGVILLDIPLQYTIKTVENGCGSCYRCIDACPSGALKGKGLLDSSGCISYLTIESKKDHLSEEQKIDRKGWIFGCDICLNACPWSKQGKRLCWDEFMPLQHPLIPEGILSLSKGEWESLAKDEFNEIFKDSPLKRAGYEKIMDNLDAT